MERQFTASVLSKHYQCECSGFLEDLRGGNSKRMPFSLFSFLPSFSSFLPSFVRSFLSFLSSSSSSSLTPLICECTYLQSNNLVVICKVISCYVLFIYYGGALMGRVCHVKAGGRGAFLSTMWMLRIKLRSSVLDEVLFPTEQFWWP